MIGCTTSSSKSMRSKTLLDYGEAEHFHTRLIQLRALLEKDETAQPGVSCATPSAPNDHESTMRKK